MQTCQDCAWKNVDPTAGKNEFGMILEDKKRVTWGFDFVEVIGEIVSSFGFEEPWNVGIQDPQTRQAVFAGVFSDFHRL
jgi:hypothetical protein